MAIKSVAKKHPQFTSDFVHTELIRKGYVKFASPNTIGAAFCKARRQGTIRSTNVVRMSDRRAARSRRILVWRSNICEAA